MKIINKIYLLGLLIGLVAFSSCQEDDLINPDPSPDAPAGTLGVYFPTSKEVNLAAFELMPTEPTEIELTIARTVSSGAVNVPIEVDVNDDNVFDVPSSVSFADGETEATFKVTFPTAAEGKTYNLKLEVEGDEYVNPYVEGLTYLTTNVTRVKWEKIEEPMVMIDGTTGTIYGVDFFPMYVYAEKAEIGDAVRYRFKNALNSIATGADEDGIFDGYPYNDPEDIDPDNDYYTIIEVGGEMGGPNDVFMYAGTTGMDWGEGIFTIGSVYGNLSDKKDTYPLGTLKNGIITFPANSLFASMANFNDGGKYPAGNPTYIYFTKEIYIAANLKIEDFNDIEYEEEAVQSGTFKSETYGGKEKEEWAQEVWKAVDADPDNDESEYKNLYYLPNLYADGLGLAFYYTEEAGVKIPKGQKIGLKFLGKDVYVSQSEEYKSELIVGDEEELDEDIDEEDIDPDFGLDRYHFGLTFHFEDETALGDFEERLVFGEESITTMSMMRKTMSNVFEVQNKPSPKTIKKDIKAPKLK